MKCILEMESTAQRLFLKPKLRIGITGGVEDGVDNTGMAKDKLYSTPEDVFKARFRRLSPKFVRNSMKFHDFHAFSI